MKKLISLIVILTVAFLFGIVIDSHDTSAKQKDPFDLIKKVSYMHAPDCGNHDNPYNSTLFTVTFNWGTGCNSAICDEINGTFHCVDPGDYCTTTSHVHNGSLTVTSGSCPSSLSSKKWDCYDVYIPVDGAYQDAKGKIKRLKEYDLTVVAIDESWNRLDSVTGLAPRTVTTFYGYTASLSRGYTNTGYTFIGWADGYSGGDIYSKVLKDDYVAYAVYRGESGSSSTNITVKDPSAATKYRGDGLKTVYAKPNDTITYTASYSPGAQRSVTSWYPQVVRIGNNGSWSGACGSNNTALSLNSLFNQCRGTNNTWNNTYSVTKDRGFSDGTNPIHYSARGTGDTTARSDSNDHVVKTTEVGKTLGGALTEHSRTNSAWSTQATPKSYSIGLYGGVSSGNVDITALDSSATAYVPYNFENTPHKPHKTNPDPKDDPSPTNDNPDTVNDDTSDKIVYSGETGTFDFAVDVNPRSNPETNGTYATIVDQAKWRLRLCIGVDECNANKYDYVSQEYGGSLTDQLNKNRKLEGEKGIQLQSLTINIPDRTAGTRICVVAEVFPKTSGAYTNWNNTNYDGTWARSPRSCYTIAKRPSIQVWGGNIFTHSSISTIPSVKNNLYGYNTSDYTYNANAKNGKKGPFIFGSWGELGVVSNSAIIGFGSGASMGYANGNGTLSPSPFAVNSATSAPNPGGGRTTVFCDWVPLTIPNSKCADSIAGSLSSTVGITKATSDKESIVGLLASGDNMANRVHNPSNGKVNTAVANTAINGSTLGIISADGDIEITSDLKYLIDPYLSYEQMPKLVIYSKTNINIDCDVKRIDALLIANDTVTTCANSNDINSSANANQLFVNGAIVAKKLVANRTYGAAAGANSIVPAEIINFDPTLYQFSSSAEMNDNAGGKLDTTYIHEVAPRI